MCIINKLFFYIPFAVALVGCDSRPTDLDIEKGIKKIYECNLISVSDVKKTNGKEKDKNNYYVEFTYNVKLKLNEFRRSKSEDIFACSSEAQGFIASNGLGLSMMKKEEVKAYLTSGRSLEGRVTMEKTENGWRMTDDFRSEEKQ